MRETTILNKLIKVQLKLQMIGMELMMMMITRITMRLIDQRRNRIIVHKKKKVRKMNRMNSKTCLTTATMKTTTF